MKGISGCRIRKRVEKTFSIIIAIMLSFPLILASCQKPPFGKCGGTNGPEQILPLDDSFNRITFGDGMDILLIPDSSDYVLYQGPEYVNVEASLTDKKLILKASFHCPWYTDREYIRVEVHHSIPPVLLRAEGDSRLRSTEPIRTSFLELYSDKTSAGFTLPLKTGNLYLHAADTTPFYLSGQTDSFYCDLGVGYNRVDASLLDASTVMVEHRGSGDIHVRPYDLLLGNLKSTGNLYYYGTPASINVTRHYRGEVIAR